MLANRRSLSRIASRLDRPETSSAFPVKCCNPDILIEESAVASEIALRHPACFLGNTVLISVSQSLVACTKYIPF